MIDEILQKALPTDSEVTPRYTIKGADGSVLYSNVTIELDNIVLQEGTPLNKGTLLSDYAKNAVFPRSNPTNPTVSDAIKELAENTESAVLDNTIDAPYTLGEMFVVGKEFTVSTGQTYKMIADGYNGNENCIVIAAPYVENEDLAVDWSASGGGIYAGSTIDTYLNGTFYNSLPTAVKNAIVTASVPSRNNVSKTAGSVVNISRKVFLYSANEIDTEDKDDDTALGGEGVSLYLEGAVHLASMTRTSYDTSKCYIIRSGLGLSDVGKSDYNYDFVPLFLLPKSFVPNASDTYKKYTLSKKDNTLAPIAPIISDTYIGDGEEYKTITFPTIPSIVFVFEDNYQASPSIENAGIFMPSAGLFSGSWNDTFNTYNADWDVNTLKISIANELGKKYRYIAICVNGGNDQ